MLHGSKYSYCTIEIMIRTEFSRRESEITFDHHRTSDRIRAPTKAYTIPNCLQYAAKDTKTFGNMTDSIVRRNV